jgi:hypothetical protein
MPAARAPDLVSAVALAVWSLWGKLVPLDPSFTGTISWLYATAFGLSFFVSW